MCLRSTSRCSRAARHNIKRERCRKFAACTHRTQRSVATISPFSHHIYMRVALFGGTFDPVHLGHLAVARAAAEKFDLARVYFVPADLPPHKQKRKLTDFQHRFAMLALATADDPRFVASLLDAHTGEPNYSLETVRRLKSVLRKSDKLFFLIGIDAFRDISNWYKPV